MENEDSQTRCGQCGHKLTIVRPGKHQCDNPDCEQNHAIGFLPETASEPTKIVTADPNLANVVIKRFGEVINSEGEAICFKMNGAEYTCEIQCEECKKRVVGDPAVKEEAQSEDFDELLEAFGIALDNLTDYDPNLNILPELRAIQIKYNR